MKLPSHFYLDERNISYERKSLPPETEKGAANVAWLISARRMAVSYGLAINVLGHVTGSADTAGAPEYHAFLWNGSSMGDLTWGGSNGEGAAINDLGQVTGFAYLSGVFEHHAFLGEDDTPDPKMTDLGILGGLDSEGYAINASGQVTGLATTDTFELRAFLSDGTGTNPMDDLNDLIDPLDPLSSIVVLQYGVDINDRGQILARGHDNIEGWDHAYVVSPL